MGLHLHKKQFVIARKPILIDENWETLPLPHGFHLSFHRALNVAQHGDTYLLGTKFRFAEVAWPCISGDATNLLSIHYAHGPDGPYVSSSPALLAELARCPVSKRRLRWGGVNWFPGPGARAGRKLLRDQRLNIPLLQPEGFDRQIKTLNSFEEARECLASCLIDAAKVIETSHDKVYLGLSAGLDSRTILAAFLASGIKFEAFTWSFEGMAVQDIRIARKLARSFGIKHQVVAPRPRDERPLKTWQQHCLSSYCDADDNRLVPSDSFRFLGDGSAFVQGGIFEIGRRHYARRLAGVDFHNATGSRLYSGFEKKPNAETIASLDEWIKWRRQHQDGLNLIDAFYLEQRVGGWLAAQEQGLDAVPGTSVNPANDARILSALLTPDEPDRASGRLQSETIKMLEAKLLEIPLNPPPPRPLMDYPRSAMRFLGRLLKPRRR